jgi:hypothetical protein
VLWHGKRGGKAGHHVIVCLLYRTTNTTFSSTNCIYYVSTSFTPPRTSVFPSNELRARPHRRALQSPTLSAYFSNHTLPNSATLYLHLTKPCFLFTPGLETSIDTNSVSRLSAGNLSPKFISLGCFTVVGAAGRSASLAALAHTFGNHVNYLSQTASYEVDASTEIRHIALPQS